jgi:hypothetical protein
VLASTDVPGWAIGTPATLAVDGKQYSVLTVQGARQGERPELILLALC